MDLAIMHAAVITGFEKEVNDFPLHVCEHSCTRGSQCLSLAFLMTSSPRYGMS